MNYRNVVDFQSFKWLTHSPSTQAEINISMKNRQSLALSPGSPIFSNVEKIGEPGDEAKIVNPWADPLL